MEWLAERLAEVKAVLAAANAGIVDVSPVTANTGIIYGICLLAELKGAVKFWQSLPVKHGVLADEGFGRDTRDIEWVSHFRAADKREKVEILKAEILTLQEKIAKYDMETEVFMRPLLGPEQPVED